MKRLILVIAVVLVVAFGLTGCAQTPQTQPDIPQYTADQVIYLAQAHATPCLYYPKIGQTSASWTVEYRGDGIWLVQRTCYSPSGIRVMGSDISWLFYESTGQLVLQ